MLSISGSSGQSCHFDGNFQLTATAPGQNLSNGAVVPASFSFNLPGPDVAFQIAGPSLVGNITNVALTNDVATLTMANSDSLLVVGQGVLIEGLSMQNAAIFDGLYMVTAVTPTTFSYSLTHADVPLQPDSGTITTGFSGNVTNATVAASTGSITNVALTDDVATLTTANANSFLTAVGQSVFITGLTNSEFGGTYQVTAVTPTTFSYILKEPDPTPPPADVPSQPDSGTVSSMPLATTVNVVTLQDINAITSAGYSSLCIFGANGTGLVTGGTVAVTVDYYVRVGFPPFGFEIHNDLGDGLTLQDFNIDPWAPCVNALPDAPKPAQP